MHSTRSYRPSNGRTFEPQEGKFDFAFVDSQIQGAQTHNLRLVFLWFGSWKNGVSSYIPAWVKTNQERFPRVQDKEGKGIETLSTLSAANRDADARAFAALMRHIKEVDTYRTVVMIQVENEVGVLGDSRDRCEAANQAFAGPVPKELMDYLGSRKDSLHRCSARRGKRPVPRHPGPGKRSSARRPTRMSFSWPGTMPAT